MLSPSQTFNPFHDAKAHRHTVGTSAGEAFQGLPAGHVSCLVHRQWEDMGSTADQPEILPLYPVVN